MAYLFDTGIFSAVTSASAVMAGAKLYFYDAGTTTLKDTYTSSALDPLSKNANPVVADANGRWPAIWMEETLYKVKFASSDETVIITRDDVGREIAGGEVGFSSSATYASGTIGFEAAKPYKSPSVSFTWTYGSAAAKAQIVSEANMALDGAKPLFGIVRQWNTSVGVGTVPYQVGRAESMVGNTGGGNFYTWNPISQVNAGWTGDAFTTIEVNANNLSNIDFGDSPTVGDISNAGVAWAVPFNIVCLGDGRFTAGVALSAPAAAGQIYNRGYVVAGDCVRLWDYEAGSSAPIGVKIRGTRSGACVDMSDAAGSIGILLNNSMGVYTKNGSGSVVRALYQDSLDNLIIGEGSAKVVSAKSINPAVTNSLSLGATGSIWGSAEIGDLRLHPVASATPSVNGELVIQATSNTSLTFKLKGSDGTVRSGSITLS